jgi:hypothetical protein
MLLSRSPNVCCVLSLRRRVYDFVVGMVGTCRTRLPRALWRHAEGAQAVCTAEPLGDALQARHAMRLQ